MMFPHESNSSIPLSEEELAEVNSADGPGWLKSGRGYMIEHATKPSTISHAISSSPLALLAWIGEKYLDWTDQDPEIEFILEVATLWWLTETYPGSIYLYRGLLAPDDKERSRIQKPFGFSKFPHDILAQPRAWVEAAGELIYFQAHKKVGFPASRWGYVLTMAVLGGPLSRVRKARGVCEGYLGISRGTQGQGNREIGMCGCCSFGSDGGCRFGSDGGCRFVSDQLVVVAVVPHSHSLRRR